MASSTPVRSVGILGGTFDPIHNGHMAMACAAMEELALDEVVLIPAGEPSFKRGSVVASAADRLEMCRIACADERAISVSSIEVDRWGVTYSVDTVRQLLEDADGQVRFTFLVGADAARSLPAWYDASSLASMVSFAVFPREGAGGADALDELLCSLSQAGFNVRAVPVCVGAVSSSEVRARLSCGEADCSMLSEGVARYIAERGLYSNLDCPTSDDFMAARHRQLESRVNERRLHHIDGVAETAAHLARIYGVDERRARLAGLLHDWDKDYDDDGMRARVAELGLEGQIDPFIVERMPQVLHGPTAARALSLEFPQIPDDVISAIRNHTTASIGASDLEKVLYVADAIEPSRTFRGIDELRSMVGEADLDELFFNVYKFWTLTLLEKGSVLHPDTIDIWNSLAAARRDARHGSKGDASWGKGKES